MQRLPPNVKPTNTLGYVAVRCNGSKRVPVTVKQNIPKNKVPRTVDQAIKGQFYKVVQQYAKPKVVMKAKPCGAMLAVTPGVKAKCSHCGASVYVEPKQAKPYARGTVATTKNAYEVFAEMPKLEAMAKSVSRKLKAAKLAKHRMNARIRANWANDNAEIILEDHEAQAERRRSIRAEVFA